MKKVFCLLVTLLLFGLEAFGNTNISIYNEVWETINNEYYSETFNQKEWAKWKNIEPENIDTKDELENSIKTMLSSLDDQFTMLFIPIEAKMVKSAAKSNFNYYKRIFSFKPDIEKIKIPKNIKYIIINSFENQNVSKGFYKIVKKFKKYDAFIIDLRWNGGGMVKMAAEVANMLIKDCNIVSTIDNQGNRKDYKANNATLTDKPVIVLVNGDTASAAEILSAALQDTKRAIIIGEKTYGKGIVQKNKELPNGYALNYTIYEYLTPSGKSIHKKGVTPDIEVILTEEDFNNGLDTQLRRALEELKNK